MSDQIPVFNVDAYNDGIEILAQQMPSKVAAHITIDTETGKRKAFDQIGAVAARQVTERHGDTQYINTPHKRRWAGLKHFDVADLLDPQDILQILNNPGGEYSRNFIAALNREMDQNAINAAIGTALEGEDGTIPVTFPSAQIILHGGTGFTLAKVRQAMKKFKTANVDFNTDEITMFWTSAQEETFVDTTEVKSVDFNSQRVLVKGGMGDDTFYGFRYVNLEDWVDELGDTHLILPKAGTVRSCVAVVRRGVVQRRPAPPSARVDELPGKRYSTQFYAAGSFDAVRRQDTFVVQIDVQET